MSALKAANRLQSLGVTLLRRILAEAPAGALHLSLGTSNMDVPAPIQRALQQAKSATRADYGPNAGDPLLRKLIAEREGVAPEQVLITNGVQEGISLSLLGTIDPGDLVVVPDPAFPVYASLSRVAGGIPVPWRLQAKQGFRPTLESLAPLLDNGPHGMEPRAIVLCSPGNPTGAAATRAEWAAMLSRIATMKRPPLVISDEIYRELQHQDDPHPSARAHLADAIVLSGPAKTLGLAGWRLGWTIVPDALVDPLTALHQHLVTSASTLPQEALAIALSQHASELDAHRNALRERLRQGRDRARSVLLDAGWEVHGGDGAFYLWVRPPHAETQAADDLAICRRLMHETGVVLIPGSAFGEGGAGYLRLSYSVAPETLELALTRLRSYR